MISPKDIIDKISQLQSTDDTIYRTGLFPSQRVNTVLPCRREDNNIFFSALIAFTLQQIHHHLSTDLQNQVDKIIEAVRSNYPYFKSDKGTYNFWEPGGANNFPNGWVLHKFNRLAIPDDADDSSLIMLTSSPSKDHLLWYKNKLENHYPSNSAVSPLTPSTYRDLRAYPTFFGKRILREMDACVISNVLYMVCHYQLPWTSVDSDSVQFLKRVLEQQDYHKSPFLVSPHYGNSSVILYHMARLVDGFNRKELLELRMPLIQCLKLELKKKLSSMEILLVKTSLLRLQIKTALLPPGDNYEGYFRNFYFFQAGLLTGFQFASLTWLAQHSFFHLKYRCEAYYWALLLEYLVLVQNH